MPKRKRNTISDKNESNYSIIERMPNIYSAIRDFLLYPFARVGLLGDLYYASRTGNLLLIRALINAGRDKNAADVWGEPPLHYAISSGNINAVRYLLEQGADREVRDRQYRSPLCAAIHYNHIDIVRYLIEEQGADIAHIKELSYMNVTPLHYAAFYGRTEIVSYLIEHGADIEARANENKTPLHYAASLDHIETIHCLVDKGADINSQDINGLTPAQYARDPVVIELLANREEIHRAAIEGDIDRIQNILKMHPEKLELIDNEKKTPLIHATIHARKEVVDFLLTQGANPERIANCYVGDHAVGVIDNLLFFAKESKNADFIKWIKSRVGLTKEYLLKIEEAFYNLLKDELLEARKNDKKLVVVLGEFHGSYTLTQIEKRILKVAKKIGITTVFGEVQKSQSEFSNSYPPTINLYFAKQKLKMDVVGVDNHPNKSTIFSAGDQGIELRNEVMADEVNADGILIVGVAHLKGLLNQGEICRENLIAQARGLDANKLHIVPFNLASIWEEKAPSFLHSDFYNNPEFVIQIRGERFSDPRIAIDNCNTSNIIERLAQNENFEAKSEKDKEEEEIRAITPMLDALTRNESENTGELSNRSSSNQAESNKFASRLA